MARGEQFAVGGALDVFIAHFFVPVILQGEKHNERITLVHHSCLKTTKYVKTDAVSTYNIHKLVPSRNTAPGSDSDNLRRHEGHIIPEVVCRKIRQFLANHVVELCVIQAIVD